MNIEQGMTNCPVADVNEVIKKWNKAGWLVTTFHMDEHGIVYLLLSRPQQ